MVTYSEIAGASFPDMSGKVVLITGATSGIGLEAARIFVKRGGAHVVLACRSLPKAAPIVEELNTAGPGRATVVQVDTADVDSVRACAAAFDGLGLGRLDVLILNAGIMFGPWATAHTADTDTPVVERQFATNHLGHFLLTQLLLPTLRVTPGARIVSVSSVAATFASTLDVDVVTAKTPQKYDPFRAYSVTKLSNLLFVREMQRRMRAAALDIVVVPCHPGYAATDLTRNTRGAMALLDRFVTRPLLSHSAVEGSHPIVLAAIDPHADADPNAGSYYAPQGFWQMYGDASSTAGRFPAASANQELATELWALSEKLSGVSSTI